MGTTPVVTAGLLGLGVTPVHEPAVEHEMAYWPLGIWFFFLSMFMGWIMGPATGSVMSAVPEEKSGVASAMNDVTRQVAGALGTAVIGSLITSLYASNVGDSTASLPESARVAAEDSIGQAQGIAASLPVAEGARFADAAAVLVKRLLPNDTARKPESASRAAPALPSTTAMERSAA